MTESSDQAIDVEAQARIEKLRQRRAASAPTTSTEPAARTAPPRRTPALGTRIAAVGIGGTTLFGLMAALALTDQAGATPETTPPPTTPQPIVVVIHTNGSGGGVSSPVAAEPASDSPIELRAQPVVRTVEVPAAGSEGSPAASTNGSR